MSEWKTIDSAPRDGAFIDVFVFYEDSGRRVADVKWATPYKGEESWCDWNFLDGWETLEPQPSHWMPLPEPPK